MLVFTLLACGEKIIPHGGNQPSFPLVGAHAYVPCAGCHGPGEPEAQSRSCAECHTADAPPDHFIGQECNICHDEYDWANVDTVLPTDTGPPTETGTPEPTGFVHPTTAPDALCWSCHEEDRKLPDHYTDPSNVPEGVDDAAARWDCSPCHTQTAWADTPIEHPIRSPHGANVTDASQWVVACTTCHPVAPPAFDCTPCHAPVFEILPHTSLVNDPSTSPTCIGCHPEGEK